MVIVETILITFLMILMICLFWCVHLMFRNDRVCDLRFEILRHAIPGEKSFLAIIDLCDKYIYDEILYSFRSIKSFRGELLHEIKLIKIKGGEK